MLRWLRDSRHFLLSLMWRKHLLQLGLEPRSTLGGSKFCNPQKPQLGGFPLFLLLQYHTPFTQLFLQLLLPLPVFSSNSLSNLWLWLADPQSGRVVYVDSLPISQPLVK